ncbi:hypothetical protein [Actinophytocola sediminis]
MVVLLLIAGGLATPVTGLLIRPDTYGARHGLQMFTDIGQFAWYGYLVVSVAMVAFGAAGVRAATTTGRRRARGAAGGLRTLTVVFGAIHVVVVARGMNYGEGRPLLAAVAAVVCAAAVFALVTARARLRSQLPRMPHSGR